MNLILLSVVSSLVICASGVSHAMPLWTCKGQECEEDRGFGQRPADRFQSDPASTSNDEVKAQTPKEISPHLSRTIQIKRKPAPRRYQGTPANESQENQSNLPSVYLARNLVGYQLEGKPTLVASKENIEIYDDLNTGDIVHVLIEQAITASPSLPSPVRAEIIDSRAKGSFLVGEAKLEAELKRVILSFTKLRDIRSGDTYQLTGSGLSPSGEVGLVGEYHSQDGKFFLAELLATGVAGVADATISRSQGLYGNMVEKPGLDTAAKKGIVSALSQTSQRMAEREKKAPEYTHVNGYQIIPVLITERPKKTGS